MSGNTKEIFYERCHALRRLIDRYDIKQEYPNRFFELFDKKTAYSLYKIKTESAFEKSMDSARDELRKPTAHFPKGIYNEPDFQSEFERLVIDIKAARPDFIKPQRPSRSSHKFITAFSDHAHLNGPDFDVVWQKLQAYSKAVKRNEEKTPLLEGFLRSHVRLCQEKPFENALEKIKQRAEDAGITADDKISFSTLDKTQWHRTTTIHHEASLTELLDELKQAYQAFHARNAIEIIREVKPIISV